MSLFCGLETKCSALGTCNGGKPEKEMGDCPRGGQGDEFISKPRLPRKLP